METSETVQQEIAQLEKQLAEKKADLEQQSSETKIEVPHDKEILRQVVGEKIQQHLPAGRQALQGYQPAPQKPQDDQLSYNDPQLVGKVQELVNIAFTKGVDDAVRSVVQSGNPALIDAFHDVLVDQLYDALVERKKIDEVK